MLEWVLDGCKSSTYVNSVILATPDEEIADFGESQEVEVRITSHEHTRATDRMAEVMEQDEVKADIYVLVQGDEPLVSGNDIDRAIEFLIANSHFACVNLTNDVTPNEVGDGNCIKVVTDSSGAALYFSRADIPNFSHGTGDINSLKKQVCVIPIWREALEAFAKQRAGSLEVAESIDMLRFLEAGRSVGMVHTDNTYQAVDVPSDIQRVEALLEKRGLP
jgi:3-deoxy-manno-octulosonate cytidylyltransferase (CMP-KDO synthetase)